MTKSSARPVTVKASVTLSQELHTRLKVAAIHAGVSLSDYITAAAAAYLKKEKV